MKDWFEQEDAENAECSLCALRALLFKKSPSGSVCSFLKRRWGRGGHIGKPPRFRGSGTWRGTPENDPYGYARRERQNMLLTAAGKYGWIARYMQRSTTTYDGGPEGEALQLLKRFSDESKSLTLREATAGSGMSLRRAKSALEVLLEYRDQSQLLTATPLQNTDQAEDSASFRITPFAKGYLTWKEAQMQVGGLR